MEYLYSSLLYTSCEGGRTYEVTNTILSLLRGCEWNEDGITKHRVTTDVTQRMPGLTLTHKFRAPAENQSDHVRAMPPSHSTICDQMHPSLDTLGGDILLEVVSWISRVDLLNLVVTVRFSSPSLTTFDALPCW